MNDASTDRLLPPAAHSTQASTVYDRLRADLLSGRLEPGRKLPMRFLIDAYATGQTPLREALNRLSAEGLVECQDQRGFSVAGISRAELVELNQTRCWVESLAVREAMARATPQWEEDVLLAEHRLARTPRSLSGDRYEGNPEWERLHRAFHRTLIVQCGSRPLVAFCDQLTDQLYRYRQLSIRKAFPERQVAREHQAIRDSVLNRETDTAVKLLVDHYTATADVILSDPAIFPDAIPDTHRAQAVDP